MQALILIVGVVAALVIGGVGTLLGGIGVGVGVAVLVVAIAVYGTWWAVRTARTVILGVLVVGALVVGGYGAWQTYSVVNGVTVRSGPADLPDQAKLASGTKKLETAKDAAAFRLELTDSELTAVVQDAVRTADAPIRRVDLHFVGAQGAQPGALKFDLGFKNGTLNAAGAVSYTLEKGGLAVAVRDLRVGSITLPKPLLTSVEDIVKQTINIDSVLAENRVTVQSLAITDGVMTLIGTSGNGKVVTSQALLDGIKSRQAQNAGKRAPNEQYGPGLVNALEGAGTPLYVALGDSLAANVGVQAARDGYVSRFHKQLQTRDNKQYGLRNFGIAGETSGTMLRGQLDAAVAFMQGKDVAYVTIDVGSNDVLPHLSSDDCANGAGTAACKARVEASLATYRANLAAIMQRVKAAAPNAKVLFLQAYNPFSFGFSGLSFEADSDAIVQQMNGIASDVAKANGAIVADGFTPMKGLATVATHMSEASPDIHPLAIGYDLLTGALVNAR